MYLGWCCILLVRGGEGRIGRECLERDASRNAVVRLAFMAGVLLCELVGCFQLGMAMIMNIE